MLQGSQWPQDPTLLDNSDDQSSWKDELGGDGDIVKETTGGCGLALTAPLRL